MNRLLLKSVLFAAFGTVAFQALGQQTSPPAQAPISMRYRHETPRTVVDSERTGSDLNFGPRRPGALRFRYIEIAS